MGERFNLAVGGELPDDPKLRRQIDDFTGQLRACLARKGEAASQIEMLASPAFTSPAWGQAAALGGFTLHACRLLGEDSPYLGQCRTCVNFDSGVRSIAAEWLCDQADLVLLVWNEEAAQCAGTTWELMQTAHRKKTPCVWLSSASGRMYWALETYYAPYSPVRLQALCDGLDAGPVAPSTYAPKRSPLIALGSRWQARFLKKHRAQSSAMPAQQDGALKQDYTFAGESPAQKQVHEGLLAAFERFDRPALELSARYRATIYWRAILPFITTAFLAVGFYAETLLGYLYLPSGMAINPWSIVAGVGFLAHALLNLYVYVLSRSKSVRSWHLGFLKDRFLAEVLRVLTHFMPFGVGLDLRRLCGANAGVYALARKIVRGVEPCSVHLDQVAARELVASAAQMVEDQLAYNSQAAARYRRVADNLQKWAKWAFIAGFTLVLLRGLLQFFIVYIPMEGANNGISAASFIKSFANMLALMLPAWAAYFTSKLGQCNYAYLAQNHERAVARLSQERARLEELAALNQIPVDILTAMISELAESMLVQDTAAWYDQIAAASVTKL